MGDRNALESAFEQFYFAVRSLTMGNEPLDERLSQAWLVRLRQVRESELDNPGLSARIAAVKARCEDAGDLDETGQAALAAEIVDTYTAMAEQLGLASSPR